MQMHRPPQTTTIEIGATGEDRAVELLVRHGYVIVERNFRCKAGELDIIAFEGRTLVFVEVRTRRTPEHGSALHDVAWGKRRQVSRVASLYVAWKQPSFESARFDVVAITGTDATLIRDAWRLGDRM
jgi:putative endonuclease